MCTVMFVLTDDNRPNLGGDFPSRMVDSFLATMEKLSSKPITKSSTLTGRKGRVSRPFRITASPSLLTILRSAPAAAAL